MSEPQSNTLLTSRQLAEAIGCSVQSIYRWEKQGVIPKAQRLSYGETSARVYTQEQLEEIRKLVNHRIGRGQDQRYLSGDSLEALLRFGWAALFVRALKAARQRGCQSLTMINGSGDVEVFTR